MTAVAATAPKTRAPFMVVVVWSCKSSLKRMGATNKGTRGLKPKRR